MDIRSAVLWFAANWRVRNDEPFVIAVTGSIAKTSTKEAIGAVLGAAYGSNQVRVGYGNLNTELGLPLAILGYRIDFYKQKITWQWPFILFGALARGLLTHLPRYLVIEMGADRPGDLGRLTSHIRPDIGIVTIIGEAHLMNYGSAQELASEKAEILRAIKPTGNALINHRDPFRAFLAKQAVVALTEFDCATADIAHTVAQMVGKQLGVQDEVIGRALSSNWRPEGRLTVHESIYTVINDSYNASPTSMRSALEKLSRLPGRKVAILGSMLELGSNEVRFHQEIGERAHQVADLVIGVGELAHHYRPDQWFKDSQEAAHEVVAFLAKGDSILVKGSHGIRMDVIVETLLASSGDDPTSHSRTNE
jgi:UDP-N-acetylmuramoyl-tripeptide--D-alanyl-D-alanine ligase